MTNIEPRHGNVRGGETVQFYSDGFTSDAVVTITIDGVECTDVVSASGVASCTTGPMIGYTDLDPELVISIEGKGRVSTADHVYRYLRLWSDHDTWGGTWLPLHMDSVSIPKGVHVLYDLEFEDEDQYVEYNLISIEGSLIFADYVPKYSGHRIFKAHYIMVQKGYLEIGTEDHPYT